MALEHGWLKKILSCLTPSEFEAKKKAFEPKSNKYAKTKTNSPNVMVLSGQVRKPSLREKNDFFKQITYDPKCPKCAEIIWYEDTHHNPNMKQKLFARHAFKKHLMEEMKVSLIFLDFVSV